MRILLVMALPILLAACKNGDKNGENGNNNLPPQPKSISYSLGNPFPHDTSSYTQGLVIYKGELYEGTGLEKKSRLMKVDLTTGKALQSIKLGDQYFGEGITILNDTVYQLTYKNKVVFMYRLKDFKQIGEFTIPTEGWGLTTNGSELIVSDGTSNLNFYEPGTFRLIRTVSLTEAGEMIDRVNELEYIDGYVYANRYQTDQILKIDPVTGVVVAKADLSALGNDVRAKYPWVDFFNGIAYDSASKKMYITGKLWPWLYEVQLSN
jgi:glutamine cyclotransferase